MTRRKTREKVSPLLSEAGDVVTEGAEVAELLSVFFASVSAPKSSRQKSQSLGTKEQN